MATTVPFHMLSPHRAGSQTAQADEIGLIAHAALRSESNGRVMAAFDRSFYTTLDDRWICIGSKTIGSGPLHLLFKQWPLRPVTPGQEVTVVGTTLYVNAEPLANFEAAAIWSPDRAPNWTLDSLRIGLRAADDVWNATPTDDGLAALAQAHRSEKPSLLIKAAAPGVGALKRIVADGLRNAPANLADREALIGLIGLGPGLTPSGDDVLLGALLALEALGFRDTRDRLWNICRDQLDRTNDISRAHLEVAALGYGAAALHDAIHAVLGGRVDLVPPALSAVSAIGQTSGRDGFAGVLTVVRAVKRHLAGTTP